MSRRRCFRVTQRKREAFLDALRQGLSITGACEIAGISAQTIYNLRWSNEAFRAASDTAIEEGTDRLEDEARRRAVEGIEAPLVSAGKLVTTTRRYSDRLLILLLKSRRPEKYRELTSIEHGGGIDVTDVKAAVERKLAGLAAAGAAPGVPGEPD